MSEVAGGSILEVLEDLEAPSIDVCSRGVKLSKITATAEGTVDIRPLLGKFQQLGLVKIVYNPSVDDEPLVQITEEGKLRMMELFFSLQKAGK